MIIIVYDRADQLFNDIILAYQKPFDKLKKRPELLQSQHIPGAYILEQDTGIEPACSAWEADILPLN